jgi:hypothetical protein
MNLAQRITIGEYATTEEAAEALLLRSGLTGDIVSRAGRSIRVVAPWEGRGGSDL